MSVQPRFYEKRPTGGILSSSIISLYACFLLLDSTTTTPWDWTCVIGFMFFVLVLVHDVAMMGIDNEYYASKQGAFFQHLTMIGAALYFPLLVGGWGGLIDGGTERGAFSLGERSTFSVIAEQISSLCCVGMYIWYMAAPILFPDRDFL
jgi:hypothetical protein